MNLRINIIISPIVSIFFILMFGFHSFLFLSLSLGYGRFELTLKRYTSYRFDVVATSEIVDIGEPVFYAASLESSANLTVLLDNCWTTPGSNPNDTMRYDLIVDG